MKSNHKLAIALVAGVAVGGAVIQGLHARNHAPPVYVVVNIDAVTDPEGFKAIPAKSGPETLAPFGGKYIIRTEKVTALDGPAPKRFVVIAFDSAEKAKGLEGFQQARRRLTRLGAKRRSQRSVPCRGYVTIKPTSEDFPCIASGGLLIVLGSGSGV